MSCTRMLSSKVRGLAADSLSYVIDVHGHAILRGDNGCLKEVMPGESENAPLT